MRLMQWLGKTVACLLTVHDAHASASGTNPGRRTCEATFSFGAARWILRRRIRLKIAIENHGKTTCDKASPAVAVVLHLPSRYVSKAAILTLPILPVPVENRSPA